MFTIYTHFIPHLPQYHQLLQQVLHTYFAPLRPHHPCVQSWFLHWHGCNDALGAAVPPVVR